MGIQLGAKTLTYKTKKSNKTSCEHCIRFEKKPKSKHHKCYDEESGYWVEICLDCGMVTEVPE